MSVVGEDLSLECESTQIAVAMHAAAAEADPENCVLGHCQSQKALWLILKEVPELESEFPYLDYRFNETGPYSSVVYNALCRLAFHGSQHNGWIRYKPGFGPMSCPQGTFATERGRKEGLEVLNSFPQKESQVIRNAVKTVLSMEFCQLGEWFGRNHPESVKKFPKPLTLAEKAALNRERNWATPTLAPVPAQALDA